MLMTDKKDNELSSKRFYIHHLDKTRDDWNKKV